MHSAEIKAWVEGRPLTFRAYLAGMAAAARKDYDTFGWHYPDSRRSRKELRLVLRAALLAHGRRPDPDCVNEYADELMFA